MLRESGASSKPQKTSGAWPFANPLVEDYWIARSEPGDDSIEMIDSFIQG
jgi:hypothetical protein